MAIAGLVLGVLTSLLITSPTLAHRSGCHRWPVQRGYAQVMTAAPNAKYQDLFLKLQREAMEAGRGLWVR